MGAKISAFIVEEHNEAFFIWHYAVHHGLIRSADNVLVHVDEHSDLSTPRLNMSIKDIDSLEKAYECATRHLGIASFIVPSLYRGLFNACHWFKLSGIPMSTEKKHLIYTHEGKGMCFFFDHDTFDNRLIHPDARGITMAVHTKYDDFPEDQEVVLDIDLDYFSSNTQPYEFEGRIETTPEEFARFNGDPYHFLRLHNSNVQAQMIDGRPCFVFNRFDDIVESPVRRDESEILEKMDGFVGFLREKRVKPRIIDICRSRMSGFTPADQCGFIEENLLEKLAGLFDLDTVHVSDLKY